MNYKYKLKEQDGDETSSSREQVSYDIVLTPKGISVEDTVKALETLDNYGMYVSNMRNKSSIQKALETHFGPVIPAKRKKMERDQGFLFPVKTKTAIDDFVKSLTSKPTLLKYKVKDDTIVFPKSGNAVKDLTKKIIDTVMKSAKIDYSLADKESVDEASVDKLDQEAKIYFMQQVKAGKIKELPKDPKAEYMKIKMSEGYDEFDMEDEGPDYNNISDLEDELRRLIRFSNQYGSKGADAKIEQLKQRIDQLKNQVNEDIKTKMTKKDLKEVIREQIKSLIK
jgi:hypothetical protein